MRLPFVWEEARGATVKDPDGNILIDLAGGNAVNNVGHTHPHVVEAVRAQAGKLMHALDMVNPKRVELAKRLSEIMPQGLRGNCFTAYSTGGSGAIEIALKYAKRITGRNEILAFQGAYHGVYHGSLALTCSPRLRTGWGSLMAGVHHLPFGYCYRCFIGLAYPSCDLACAKYVDQVLNTPYSGITDAAAVIVEPIQGEGGYVDPPDGFYQRIKRACEKAGTLFIVDEIQSGFGRTGKMWAIEHWGVEPDILVWGKGVGGDLPITGVTSKRRTVRGWAEATSP